VEIDSAILKSFLEKATLNKTDKITSLVMETTDNELYTRVTLNNVILIDSRVPQSVFTGFTKNQVMAIRNSNVFSKLVAGFKGKVQLAMDGNFITLNNETKKASYKTVSEVDENTIPNDARTFNLDKIQFEKSFTMLTKTIEELKADCRAIDATNIQFHIKDNVLKVQIKNDEDNVEHSYVVQYPDCHFEMSAENFTLVFNTIDAEKVELFINSNDMPMKIVEQHIWIKNTIFLTPIVHEE